MSGNRNVTMTSIRLYDKGKNMAKVKLTKKLFSRWQGFSKVIFFLGLLIIVSSFFMYFEKCMKISMGVKCNIEIFGLKHLDKERIEKILQGKDFVNLRIKELHEKILKLPWISSVSLQKVTPNKVIVRIEEHEPFALCCENLNAKYLNVINREGHVIANMVNPHNWKEIKSCCFKVGNLPILYGKLGHDDAKIINQLQNIEELKGNIAYFSCVEQRRWNIVLNDECELLLPEEEVAEAIWRLKDFINKNSTSSFKTIDFRHKERAVVQFKK